ncbi:hypothetical protein C8R44DRAFT_845263 [Mycena epipterygia]|nr:hypothetical protein C8R44DRAFT_845263 [Mycena epipterygia]
MPLLTIHDDYTKRDAPRIAGSEAGFIGLVVGLIVFILGSCVAIYILLRDHEPSPHDREARRHAQDTPARYPSAPNGRAPWSAKLAAMLPFNTPSGGTKTRKGGHGWIQASGDAWEADEVDRGRSREMSGLDAPFRPPTDPYTASSLYSSESIAYDPVPVTRYAPTLDSIPRSASPESESTVHPGDNNNDTRSKLRHFSIESGASVRTFEGGTKFIEGL